MLFDSLTVHLLKLADATTLASGEAMNAAVPAAEKAGLPQFDPAVFVPQIIWLAITFGIFYFLMSRLVLPRIGDVLEDREERIADDLDQAQQLSNDAANLQDTFEGALSEARAKAMQSISDARAEAQSQIDAKAAEVDAQLAAQAEEAEARIASEKAAALSELETVASGACKDIIQKLLGQSVDSTAIEKAVKNEVSRRSA